MVVMRENIHGMAAAIPDIRLVILTTVDLNLHLSRTHPRQNLLKLELPTPIQMLWGPLDSSLFVRQEPSQLTFAGRGVL